MLSGGNATGGNATAVAFSAGNYFTTSVCPQWLDTNHLLFQLANIFLFLSYMAPAGLYGLLYLRICLTIGSFFFALWGYVILCAFDTMVWNAFFTAINLVHVCVLMYVLRPVRLPPNMELVYRELFQPLKVSRQQFQPAAACVKTLRDLEPQETYSMEGVTRADCLTLVLSGRFLVSHKNRPLQIVDRLEFLDSPEWFGVCGGGDNFQVTTTAMERCRVIVWNRDKLKLTISGDDFLKAVFDNVVGKDVVRKLLFVTETTTQNGPSADNATETTKLLIQMKEAAVRGVAHGEKGEEKVHEAAKDEKTGPSSEKLSKASEKLSKASEKLSKATEKLSKSFEKLSKGSNQPSRISSQEGHRHRKKNSSHVSRTASKEK